VIDRTNNIDDLLGHEWDESQRGDAWEPPGASRNGHAGSNRYAAGHGTHPASDTDDSLTRLEEKAGQFAHGDDRAPDQRGDAAEGPEIVLAGDLIRAYPNRRGMVIDGLIRVGETANIIAPPKFGKSWLILLLAFSVALGRRWLDTFQCTAKPVLIIDNELHPETLAHRLRVLCKELGIDPDSLPISIVCLRGKLQDLGHMGKWLLGIEKNRFGLIIIDAWYRSLPKDLNENDNAQVAGVYNLLDCYASDLGSAFALIHHSSKGAQNEKAVTDVGSGAGSQSRAADAHVILRAHEEPDAVVLEAAVRSWAPVEPCCLRWKWPLWSRADDLDPTQLRLGRPKRTKAPEESSEPAWDAKRFAEAFGKNEPRVRSLIIDEAIRAGLSDRKAVHLLNCAVEQDLLFCWQDRGRGGKLWFSRLPKPIPVEPEKQEEPAQSVPEKIKPAKRKKRGAE
jgi:hypothetical protein